MRKWIDIVEAALSADLLRKISPNTEQGRKNAETIERLQAEIEAEETRKFSSVPAHARRFDADSEDWAEEMRWLDYELEQKKKTIMPLKPKMDVMYLMEVAWNQILKLSFQNKLQSLKLY